MFVGWELINKISNEILTKILTIRKILIIKIQLERLSEKFSLNFWEKKTFDSKLKTWRFS